MAAKVNDRVMQFVAKAMEKDPDLRSTALYDQAKKVDRSVGRLSLRQFHALYPLRVMREKAAAAGGSSRRRKASAPAGPRRGPGRPPGSGRKAAESAAPAADSGNRNAVRNVLIEFASAVASADGKAEMIGVMSNLDNWVDEVMRVR